MKRGLLFFLTVMSSVGLAGQIKIETTGTAREAAEFSNVSVTVHSRCFKTGREAVIANGVVEQEVAKLLNDKIKEADAKDLEDPFTAAGGATYRQHESYYDPETQKTAKLCYGFRTSKTLTAKIAKEDLLAGIQDDLYAIADKHPQKEEAAAPQTWIEFGQPTGAVSEKTYAKMEKNALENAIAKALAETQVYLGKCSGFNPKVVAIQTPRSGVYPSEERAARAMDAPAGIEGGRPQGVFKQGTLSVSVTRLFTVEFEGGSITCEVPKK